MTNSELPHRPLGRLPRRRSHLVAARLVALSMGGLITLGGVALSQGTATADTPTATSNIASSTPVFTASSPSGTAIAGFPYSYQFVATSSSSVLYSVSSGTLPLGLSLDRNSGLLSGVPSVLSTSKFVVNAMDFNSEQSAYSAPITITVVPMFFMPTFPPPPAVTPPPVMPAPVIPAPVVTPVVTPAPVVTVHQPPPPVKVEPMRPQYPKITPPAGAYSGASPSFLKETGSTGGTAAHPAPAAPAPVAKPGAKPSPTPVAPRTAHSLGGFNRTNP